MKAFITLIAAIWFGTCFASQSFAISSQTANQLASVWKQFSNRSIKLDKSDITMGYGGADVVKKPFISVTAIA
jgi:hypothetical protein